MAISRELSSSIRQRIADLLALAENQRDWRYALAKNYNALGLYADFGGCLALTPDGEVLEILDDFSGPIPNQADRFWKNLALCQGSKIYPELAVLIDPKPETAQTCRWCNGTGRLEAGHSIQFSEIICRCGGLGWEITKSSDVHFSTKDAGIRTRKTV
ncbi:MAG: hypothetical protein K1Y36_28315 [Blastocatellia bacterium]|nr:hypothetical protein [Blastocatellia bacterium]